MKYKFCWKSKFFWKTSLVTGHKYLPEQNKMVLYLPNGSIREISSWTSCEARLGIDWVLATKSMMEREAGTSIKLNVEENG